MMLTRAVCIGNCRATGRATGAVDMMRQHNQAASGAVEIVRTLLTTWLIPNNMRKPTDLLAAPPAMEQFLSIHAEDPGRGSWGAQPVLVGVVFCVLCRWAPGNRLR